MAVIVAQAQSTNQPRVSRVALCTFSPRASKLPIWIHKETTQVQTWRSPLRRCIEPSLVISTQTAAKVPRSKRTLPLIQELLLKMPRHGPSLFVMVQPLKMEQRSLALMSLMACHVPSLKRSSLMDRPTRSVTLTSLKGDTPVLLS